MSTRTDDVTALELRAVISAARRLLDRVELDGAGEATQRQLGALADDLDAIASHPVGYMAAEVERHIDTLANPAATQQEGMTVGDALVTMARLGFYDPKLLAS